MTGTGRCVKINAFLEQELGFRNTSRLQGGIVTYARHVQDRQQQRGEGKGDVSSFVGVNYVFDDRMGSRVTDDVLASCEICGTACDTFRNCKNETCSVRYLHLLSVYCYLCPCCCVRMQV